MLSSVRLRETMESFGAARTNEKLANSKPFHILKSGWCAEPRLETSAGEGRSEMKFLKGRDWKSQFQLDFLPSSASLTRSGKLMDSLGILTSSRVGWSDMKPRIRPRRSGELGSRWKVRKSGNVNTPQIMVSNHFMVSMIDSVVSVVSVVSGEIRG